MNVNKKKQKVIMCSNDGQEQLLGINLETWKVDEV